MKIEVCNGSVGIALYVDDVRVAGPRHNGLMTTLLSATVEAPAVAPVAVSVKPYAETAIRKAVYDVLRTNEWPIYQMADDRGLDRSEYADFAIEVLRILSSIIPATKGGEVVTEILDARQKRAETLHDMLLEVREALRAKLNPDTPAEERAVYEKLNAALYVLRGDPFDIHMRAALSAQDTDGVCPICRSDCASANPPVYDCPMRPNPAPSVEEIAEGLWQTTLDAICDGVRTGSAPDAQDTDRVARPETPSENPTNR
ncbi:hypothetical protein [Mesorhizobium sp. URHB0026]